MKLNTYIKLLKIPTTIENFHNQRNQIDKYLDDYGDYESFFYLITKIEKECLNIFYPLNYN